MCGGFQRDQSKLSTLYPKGQAESVMAALVLFKLAGALATATLVADLSYVQFLDLSCEAGSGEDRGESTDGIGGTSFIVSCTNRDLFEAYIPGTWADVVRIAVLVIGTLAALGGVLEVFCPQTVTRITQLGRRAGSLVATTTSAI